MRTNQEIINDVKNVLTTKRITVQCYYSGSRVSSEEIARAENHGEAQLKKDISDASILEACGEIREYGLGFEDGFEDPTFIPHVLAFLAERDFSSPYDNISFTVNF